MSCSSLTAVYSLGGKLMHLPPCVPHWILHGEYEKSHLLFYLSLSSPADCTFPLCCHLINEELLWQRNLLGKFKLVNCLKRRTGVLASCTQGLLNLRTHFILLSLSHMSCNHSVFLFGVSGPAEERGWGRGRVQHTKQRWWIWCGRYTDVKHGNKKKRWISRDKYLCRIQR